MSEETEAKIPYRKKAHKIVKEPKKEKIKKKFKFVPLTRDELLSKTSFTIKWD